MGGPPALKTKPPLRRGVCVRACVRVRVDGAVLFTARCRYLPQTGTLLLLTRHTFTTAAAAPELAAHVGLEPLCLQRKQPIARRVCC